MRNLLLYISFLFSLDLSAQHKGRANAVIESPKISCYTSVAALRAVRPADGTVATTSGYYSANDGGGATYSYNSASSAASDNGSIHIPTTGSGAGRWVLIASGRLNVKVFGAKGDGSTNDTRSIQNCINYGKPIYIPSGTFMITHITIPTYTNIQGLSQNISILKAIASAEPYLVTIATNPVHSCTFEDFKILGIGSTNAGQAGWRIEGTASAGNTDGNGGLWLSTFNSVYIQNFDGDQLQLVGISPKSLLPIQGLTFNKCEFVASSNPASRAIYQNGQVEQITWNECAFTGTGMNTTNEAMHFDGDLVKEIAGGGSQTFTQCYIGQAKVGAFMKHSMFVKFLGAYLEQLQGAFDLHDYTFGIVIDNSTCLETGVNAGTGYILRAEYGSDYTFTNSKYYTEPDYGVKSAYSRGASYGHISVNPATNLTDGNYDDQAVSGGVLNAYTLLTGVQGGGTVNTLRTYKSGYAEIILRAISPFSISAGGNIDVNEPVYLAANDRLILHKINNTWSVKSVIRSITRMTTTQRDAIQSPAEGMQIYNITTHTINFFNGTDRYHLRQVLAWRWMLQLLLVD